MALSPATVLAVAAELDWPQVLYRSPVMNERYHLPAGEAHWRRWAAGPPLPCDLPRALAILAALACDALLQPRPHDANRNFLEKRDPDHDGLRPPPVLAGAAR